MSSKNFARAIILATAIPTITLAHTGPTGEDYTKYRTRDGKTDCCDNDCQPVAYTYKDGHYIIYPMAKDINKPEGPGVVIDPGQVNERSATDGHAHYCGGKSFDNYGNPTNNWFIRCFIPPMQGVQRDPLPQSGPDRKVTALFAARFG